MKHPYSKIRSQLQTFGYLNCVDKITWHPKTWFWHMVGHTARVWCDYSGLLWAYESTTLNKGKSGVQMTPLAKWLKDRKHQHVYYKGCAFEQEDEHTRAKGVYSRHIDKHLGIPYPDLKQWRWRWYLVNASLDLGITQLQNKHQKLMMFCTQLSADLDIACGIIPGTENPAEWEPDNCRDDSRLERVKCKGVIIQPEIEIYYA